MDLKFEQEEQASSSTHYMARPVQWPTKQPHRETNGVKRSRSEYDDQGHYGNAPSIDRNEWYYPARPVSSSDDEELEVGGKFGNWGRKTLRGARWIRRGKMTAWGPSREDYEVERRARERLKRLIPPPRSPSPPTLPHLRSLTPPITAPYPPPRKKHTSYTSFILDPAMAHSFQSNVLSDLERVTSSLIEGEDPLRKTLGRLFQFINEDPDTQVKRKSSSLPPAHAKSNTPMTNGAANASTSANAQSTVLTTGEPDRIPKREEFDDASMGIHSLSRSHSPTHESMDEGEKRVARAPDLTSSLYKLFLTDPTKSTGQGIGSTSLEKQRDHVDKAIAALRELWEDEREYVEKLEEVREGLGRMKYQRDQVWNFIRRGALKELQDSEKVVI